MMKEFAALVAVYNLSIVNNAWYQHPIFLVSRFFMILLLYLWDVSVYAKQKQKVLQNITCFFRNGLIDTLQVTIIGVLFAWVILSLLPCGLFDSKGSVNLSQGKFSSISVKQSSFSLMVWLLEMLLVFRVTTHWRDVLVFFFSILYLALRL